MPSPTHVHTFAAEAEEAKPAPVVALIPADQQISDTFEARAFAKQLRIARQTACSDPAAAAQLLSDWMSNNG